MIQLEKKEYIFLLIIFLLMLISFIVGVGFKEHYEKQIILNELKSNFVSKNLSILDEPLDINLDYNKKLYESDKDIYSYSQYIENNYFYDENYNCQYYSFIWSLYAIKHNLDYKFITTDNHIFVLIYNETGYCLADGNNLTCFNQR